jgi:hypothetical protein
MRGNASPRRKSDRPELLQCPLVTQRGDRKKELTNEIFIASDDCTNTCRRAATSFSHFTDGILRVGLNCQFH